MTESNIVHHACGYVYESRACVSFHLEHPAGAPSTPSFQEAIAAATSALHAGQIEQGAAWAQLGTLVLMAEEHDALEYAQQGDATVAQAIALATESAAVQTLQRVARILDQGRRSGPRHPAIYEALRELAEFEAVVETSAAAGG